MNQTMQNLWKTGYLSGESMAYVDRLYEDYLANPASIDPQWSACFDALPRVNGSSMPDISHQAIRDYFVTLAYQKKQGMVSPSSTGEASKDIMLHELTQAYRTYGHKEALLDPLNIKKPDTCALLTPETYGLSANEVKETLQKLRKIYCSTLGIEYKYISDPSIVDWIQTRVESPDFQQAFSEEQQKVLLQSLTQAEGLEKYLGLKYVGQKRFSMEGADALLPMLQTLVEKAGKAKVKEVVIGMAHRGRLNILVNLLGKAPEDLFGEFEGKYTEGLTGDVKYHAGFASHVLTAQGDIVHLAMGFNPSHLEIVGPVVEGSVRARQFDRNDTERQQVIPVTIHGDAAFSGQGVVMEMLSFSQTPGFTTGGTIRIVVNNQIGFTTSRTQDMRSSSYCTDIAKMIEAPVFHVNGDDPEMVIRAIQLAFDFRMQFKRDVIIDLVCYRRHGHNEADEPAMTQPMMYEVIRKKPTVRQAYAEKLVQANVLTQEQAEALVAEYRDALDRKESPVKIFKEPYEGKRSKDWKRYQHAKWDTAVDTSVKPEVLKSLEQVLLDLPNDFTLHPTIKKLFDDYKKMSQGELPLNWGYAENLAYATLLNENYTIRFSGQDCGRGTFVHRHAVLHDFKDDHTYVPLEKIAKRPGAFAIYDSLLSEEAVLAFEYGYASTDPEALTLWEAQFGDFANGAQVVIDQFLSSGEQKWGQLAGLVMLLPHGQEGQGPEHSSARLERYLQLCAQDNIQVCVPTTPAQIFHLLRRQMLRPFRKPLIVMTPKSLLRHKLATSSLSDLSAGGFQLVIPEVDPIKLNMVKKVILCTGKVYYELLQKRRDLGREDIAILRIEQLYPFPDAALSEALSLYNHATEVIWCQDEPENQGAWFAIKEKIMEHLQHGQALRYVGTEAFAAPAVGNAKLCQSQQQTFLKEALA